MSFVNRLTRFCQKNPQKLALPELEDERIFAAAIKLLKENCVRVVHTLGPRSVLEHHRHREYAALRDRFVCLEDETHHVSTDDTILQRAGRLLDAGIVDSVLAGAKHTTAEVIRAAIATVGVAPGLKTVSGCFLMNKETRGTKQTFLFADCGVVVNPTLLQLNDIAAASVETWKKLSFGEAEPVVAFLSFSTKGSASHPFAEKTADAAKQFKQTYPHVLSDGEIQFDAALLEDIGRRKCPDSPIPGKANIFIFPDLNAGNIAYKITERLGGFDAYGPILQGTRKVFSDLSRGASVDDIFASALINHIRV